MDVRSIREELGLKPSEFARKLGISQGHVRDLETGRRKLSLNVASRMEAITNRRDIVAAVVARKTGPH